VPAPEPESALPAPEPAVLVPEKKTRGRKKSDKATK
jgi:hypothetical protein